MRKVIFFSNMSVSNYMWILITLILKTTNLESYTPTYLKPILHDTIIKCEKNLDKIFSDLTKLEYNYPVKVKMKFDDANNKYIKYTYKSDYTRPEETMFYHCKKI